MLKWIILAFFLATMAWQIMRAITKPMIKNVLTLVCIVIAFVITAILHRNGFFAEIVNKLLVKFEVGEMIISSVGPEWGPKIAGMMPGMISLLAALAAPAVFSFVFNIVFWLLKILHVNIVSKLVERRNIRREKKEFRKALQREKKHVKKIVAVTAKTNRALFEEFPEERQEEIREQYENVDDDEIEDMVERRVRKEKRRKRKQGYFKESPEHKAVSVIAGIMCGFLLFAINSLAIFYNMDIICEVTNTVVEAGEYEENDQKTKLYLVVETLDKYVVSSYEDSVVIKIYDELGVIDLLNKTVKAGGNIAGEGEEPIYGSDVAKLFGSRTLRLACAMLDVNYSDDYIREDTETLLTDNPFSEKGIDTAAKVLVDYLNGHPEAFDKYLNPESDSIVNTLIGTILRAYQDDEGKFITEPFKNDVDSAAEIVVVISENKLLAKILADDFNKADLLKDKELLGGLISAFSNLTPYRPAMESAFTLGLGMMAPMLGLPENDAAAHDALIAKMLSSSEGLTAMTEDDMINLQHLFVAASEYKINDGKLAYVKERIEVLEDKIDEKENKIAENNVRIEEIDLLVPDIETELEKIDERLKEIEDTLSKEDILDADKEALEIEKTELESKRGQLEELSNERNELVSDNEAQTTLIQYFNNELENEETGAGLLKTLEDLKTEKEQYTEIINILDYVLDPLYVIELIRDEGLVLQETGDELMAEGESLTQKGENLQAEGEAKKTELENKMTELTDKIQQLETEKALAPYEEQILIQVEINNLYIEVGNVEKEIEYTVENFTQRGEDLIQQGKNLAAKGEALGEEATELADNATKCIENFEARIAEFTPFIAYYMNWTSMHKPFMLVGEDTTSACLSMNVGGTLYVCNTDFITIETLLDVVLNMNQSSGEGDSEGEAESGAVTVDEPVIDEEGSGEGSNSDEALSGMDEFADFNVEEYLDQIPMSDLLKGITITAVSEENKGDFEGRVSPFTNLINFLIASASDNKNQEAPAPIDEEWLRATLEAFPSALYERESYFDDNSVEMIGILLADRSEFEYKGVTVEDMNNSLNFDAWDDSQVKAEDSEKLIGIIFSLVDIVKDMGNTQSLTSTATEGGDDSSASAGTTEFAALFDLLEVIGTTMDMMAETECLKGVPPILLEAILKNEMLSMVMTPSMLNGYMEDINSEDFSYATFMKDFAGTFMDLLAKLNTEGGNE